MLREPSSTTVTLTSSIDALHARAVMPNPSRELWFQTMPFCGMPIRPFLASNHSPLRPHTLGLVNHSDPATMAVAKLIIHLQKHGELHPERLSALR